MAHNSHMSEEEVSLSAGASGLFCGRVKSMIASAFTFGSEAGNPFSTFSVLIGAFSLKLLFDGNADGVEEFPHLAACVASSCLTCSVWAFEICSVLSTSSVIFSISASKISSLDMLSRASFNLAASLAFTLPPTSRNKASKSSAHPRPLRRIHG